MSTVAQEQHTPDGVWPADLTKTYSSPEVAEYFGYFSDRLDGKVQWVYWGLRPKVRKYRKEKIHLAPPWTHVDGTPIEPRRVGPKKERRFSLNDIREIALSRYRRNDATEAEMQHILRHIDLVERGEAQLLDPGLKAAAQTAAEVRDRAGNLLYATEREASNAALSALRRLIRYGDSHPEARKWQDTASEAIAALADKQGRDATTLGEKYHAKALRSLQANHRG